ncbi:group 3 secretory phospholipase A2-like protein [Lates japonicus]|uniref:phospholipase A2 n=1 Tax=Lates japonicus TaxID=270547 RepID=A0AAD3N861_LATJO|nr:group 3 secretory phospholipase A2-like protein [Lates japonicus]
MGSGHSCLRASPAGDGQTRVTFLREDAAGARSLYLTLWSEDMRLVTCEVNVNPLATERYRALCDRSGAQGREITQRFNISGVLAAPDAPCAPVSSSAPKFTRPEGRTRRKRAWILPGTLWCGRGSGAVKYEQLGMFEDTDRCCREHDHCSHIIPAFTVNYGVFNRNFYTVSRCDCDQRFRQCLLEVNDTISSMVGYSFFNILQTPCFELKRQRRCTEMYWWGMCKVSKEAPYAIFQTPLPYTTSNVTSKYGDNTDSNKLTSSEGHHVTERPAISPLRKSPKSERRCGFRDPPRGDTFFRKRMKGKRCKTHKKLSTVAPSLMPLVSRAHSTTPPMKMGRLKASKSRAIKSNKKGIGKKKSTRRGLSPHPTQRSQISPQVTANSYLQTLSTTQSSSSLTQRQKPQSNLPTAIAAVTKTIKSHKKVPKRSRCCGSRMPVRGDAFWPHCKSCLEQETTSHMATVTAAATTNRPSIKVTNGRLKMTTKTSKQDTLKILGNTATFATPIAVKIKTTASLHKDAKPQKRTDSHLLENNANQEPRGNTIAQSTHVGRGSKQNKALHNMTDNQLLCGGLKHLDECKYQIPPLEKKYNLHNMESKTAYHCDCTSRLAGQIKSFKKPSILSTLLMDFVSQYCFKLPMEEKCQRTKSCAGGFIKASDLLRALKKIEEKDSAGVRNSGSDRRRGNPVRLYKRCLRLEREADIMAQLT